MKTNMANGNFSVAIKNKVTAHCISSDGLGWEHVSVHIVDRRIKRIPTWEEMCYIKKIFWEDEDWVVQFHPAKSEYVNNDEFVLHLWKLKNEEFPTPPSFLVGVKNLSAKDIQQMVRSKKMLTRL